jgi:hypothetical protein
MEGNLWENRTVHIMVAREKTEGNIGRGQGKT